MTCVHTGRTERSHRSADMVGMAVSQKDEINILSRNAGAGEGIGQATARPSEIPAGTGVNESNQTGCTNDENVDRYLRLSALIEHPAESAFELRQIHVRRNVETRRHRERSRATELPGHSPAGRTCHTPRV